MPFDAGVRTETAPRPGGHHEGPPPLVTPADAVPPPRRATPLESTPVVGPTAAPETPPISEQVTRWHTAPEPAPDPRPDHPGDSESARGPERDEQDRRDDTAEAALKSDTQPNARPEAEPTPERPERPERAERPEPESAASQAASQAASEVGPEPVAEAGPETKPEAEAEPQAEPQPKLRRPVRWGDRVEPTDVLVHPRQSRVAEKDVDTQPVAVITDTPSARENVPAAASQEGRDTAPVPDPDHGAEAADDHERGDAGAPGTAGAARSRDESLEDTAPHPVLPDSGPAQDAPSGRLRSTPLPPEDD